MIPYIPYTKLKTFYYVAREKSFRKAARNLYVTEGAVSQQIMDLEKLLGRRILERSSRKNSLTPDGAVLFELVAPIVEKLESLGAEFEHSIGKLKGRVKIASYGTMLLYVFPNHLKEFRNKFPECEIVLFSASSKQIPSMVLSGEVDFGIASVESIPEEIVGKALWVCKRLLIAPLNHPLQKQKRLSIEDIAKYPLLMPDDRESASGRKFFDLMRSYNPNLNVVMEAFTWEVVIKYVELGFGVSIIPEIVIRPEDKKRLYIKNLSDLDERVGFSRYGILLKKGKYLSPAARELIRILSPDFNFDLPNLT